MEHTAADIPNILLPRLRRAVQSLYLLFSLYVGFKFYHFYQWAMSGQGEPPMRPPAVEAFLPISALMGLKRLIFSGKWDPVHPAGLTIFIAVLLSALLFRKGFCGWVCPVGTLSNKLEQLGRRIRLARRLPRWLDLPLLGAKYLLLGFFVYMIFWKMDLNQTEKLIFSPYNLAADAKMLKFFMSPSYTALAIIGGLAVLSVLIRNFWCRYLCPYGALLGLLALAGPIQIRRDEKACTGCKSCEQVCPSSIRITSLRSVRNCECIGCTECTAACPEGCLSVGAELPKVQRRFAVSRLLIPAGTILTLVAFWIWAEAAGRWQSQIPAEMFARFYRMIAGS